ncbi:MAG TPA: hypothetical protein VE871_19240, partial [Longimicrobium sp.]|nr:hypothetical protein [Longimicrobium sp.]
AGLRESWPWDAFLRCVVGKNKNRGSFEGSRGFSVSGGFAGFVSRPVRSAGDRCPRANAVACPPRGLGAHPTTRAHVRGADGQHGIEDIYDAADAQAVHGRAAGKAWLPFPRWRQK